MAAVSSKNKQKIILNYLTALYNELKKKKISGFER